MRGRRGGRLAGALAVDHVLDVHEAALVRTLIDSRRGSREERVDAVQTRRQGRLVGALEEASAIEIRFTIRAALTMQRFAAVDSCADDILISSVIVGVPHRHRHVALPLRIMRVGERGGGTIASATDRRRRAVRARRRQWRWRAGRLRWRRGGRLAEAIAVDHVLDVHVTALVRILVDRFRRRRHEGVRAIRADWQRHHLGALEKIPNRHRARHRAVRRAALAVHFHAVGRRAHNVLVGSVVVGVVDRYCQVALPVLRRRRRGW